ncbi:MAG TPA: serine protease, partial [Verrucomicrobiae bacterium]|nr:serine protease [Verrucomicrobiae bacterium]
MQKTLILQVDAAHAGRPAGADPLDVRDTADWLDPYLELDPEVIKAEVAKRGVKQFAAWQDWNVSQAGDGTLNWQTYMSELGGTVPGNYRLAIAPRKQPLLLSRELKIGPNDNWLVVFANRYNPAGAPPKIEVRIGGEPVAEYEVPFRQRGNEDQPPLAISLKNYQAAKKPIQIEIRQLAVVDQGNIDWRSIGVVTQLPHLYQVFEDQGVFTAIDAQQKGGAKLFTEERHYGTHAVQVTPDGQFRLTLPQPLAVRETPKWGEYRHIRFAFRKVGDGRVAIDVNRDGPPDQRPIRYDAGVGEPVGKSATRVWAANLPNQWIVMTRDLYAEFGAFDATGITVQTPDGQHALFDHVYLARRPEDFNLIPNAPPPELTNQMARRDLAKPVLDRGFPAIVMIQTKDGRIGSGVIVNPQGEVLTAGHIVATPNDECTIHLADGRALKGQMRGISRDFDIGLAKINEAGTYPFVEMYTGPDVPENQLYVGFAHGPKFEKSAKPTANILGIRRVFRGMVWTDFETQQWIAGGPLLNREGKLIGVLTKRSEFGGFLFGRIEGIDPKFASLRNGEVTGAWYPGLGPMFGLNVQSTREGAKVLE